jgi:hypothetical protein
MARIRRSISTGMRSVPVITLSQWDAGSPIMSPVKSRLRHRLAKARRRLKERLIRRGLTRVP